MGESIEPSCVCCLSQLQPCFSLAIPPSGGKPQPSPVMFDGFFVIPTVTIAVILGTGGVDYYGGPRYISPSLVFLTSFDPIGPIAVGEPLKVPRELHRSPRHFQLFTVAQPQPEGKLPRRLVRHRMEARNGDEKAIKMLVFHGVFIHGDSMG